MRGGVRVIGYHGTSLGAARRIVQAGFRPSRNDYDWLGSGIYFFEENRERARKWAIRMHGARAAAVVGAVVDLGGALDLTQQTALTALRRTAKMVERAYHEFRMDLPRNKPGGLRLFDRLLIDYHCWLAEHAEGERFPVVRGLFEEGTAIHVASDIRDLTHIQLAVRERKAIIGIWIAK